MELLDKLKENWKDFIPGHWWSKYDTIIPDVYKSIAYAGLIAMIPLTIEHYL